ncbi:ADP-ribose glycohydrolase MACROD2-like isoform X2 [Gigantopelta aegis]|uniref:ADP-ribose glycohydrolase MACROD2-like isoform X2 n=1 Tax=Gigantopelta aegis TaxID=1735272 RepID=UPI001B88CAE3|nr:ADP-ribose glycohydrolase MACROD2-like isoform X2 [Gigantopelta aegis]
MTGVTKNTHTLSKDCPVTAGHSAGKREVKTYITRSQITKDHHENMKELYLNMKLEDRRNKYKCRDKHLSLSEILTWPDYYKEKTKTKIPGKKKTEKSYESDIKQPFPVNEDINKKVSLWQGDITRLEIDIIVNAANSSLLGGGGVDGAIHSAAGHHLLSECRTLNGCDAGDAKITGGYKLPAKYVIHTVGPIGRSKGDKSDQCLKSCYDRCLQLMLDNKLKSMALPCISTGIYGFPNDVAANIALRTVQQFLNEHAHEVDRIIFCVFLPQDLNLYKQLLPRYFPLEKGPPSNTDKSPKDSETKDVEEMEYLSSKHGTKSALQQDEKSTNNSSTKPDNNSSTLCESENSTDKRKMDVDKDKSPKDSETKGVEDMETEHSSSKHGTKSALQADEKSTNNSATKPDNQSALKADETSTNNSATKPDNQSALQADEKSTNNSATKPDNQSALQADETSTNNSATKLDNQSMLEPNEKSTEYSPTKPDSKSALEKDEKSTNNSATKSDNNSSTLCESENSADKRKMDVDKDKSLKVSETEGIEAMETDDSSSTNDNNKATLHTPAEDSTSKHEKNKSTLQAAKTSSKNTTSKQDTNKSTSNAAKISTDNAMIKSDKNKSTCKSEKSGDENKMDVDKDTTEETDHRDSAPDNKTSSDSKTPSRAEKSKREPFIETSL